jgi:hypothetical protein
VAAAHVPGAAAADGTAGKVYQHWADSAATEPVTDDALVPLVYAPRNDLTKYVSVDNGATWVDANVGPGPTLDPATGFKPLFRFGVATVGNISLPGVK